MKLRTFLIAWLAVAVTTSACAAGVAIPVRGNPRWVAALAGEWNGTYIRDDRQREGAIWFLLKDGEDHAYGDVRMTPRNRAPYYPNPALARGEMLGLLGIRFVSVAEVGLEGALDPYWDPECRCIATTTFRGRLSGNRLSGTYLTRLDDGTWATGRWQAQRARRRADGY